MRRRLLNLVTLLSFLLCVAAVALWVRSEWVVDQVTHTGEGRRQFVTTADGGIDVAMQADEVFLRVPESWRWRRYPLSSSGIVLWRRSVQSPQNPFAQKPSRAPVAGFWWGTLVDQDQVRGTTVRSSVVMAPLWPLAVVSAVPPGVWGVRRWRRVMRNRRRDRGLCPACGYDLWATSDKCPECGMAVTGAG